MANIFTTAMNWATARGLLNTRMLDKTGDTMSGDLILNEEPTVDLQASTKKYVDDSIANRLNTIAHKGNVTLTSTSTTQVHEITLDGKYDKLNILFGDTNSSTASFICDDTYIYGSGVIYDTYEAQHSFYTCSQLQSVALNYPIYGNLGYNALGFTITSISIDNSGVATKIIVTVVWNIIGRTLPLKWIAL